MSAAANKGPATEATAAESDETEEKLPNPISKIAYLCVKPSTANDLVSKDELKSALQHAGYNPTEATLNKHWTKKTKKITYLDFCNIMDQEPVPEKMDLVSAFRSMDASASGLISHEEFIIAMTTRGEKLPMSLLESLLQEPHFNRDGKFDYEEFCNVVFETSKEMLRLAKEKVQLLEKNRAVNTKTYTVKSRTAKDQAKNSPSTSPKHGGYRGLAPEDDYTDRFSWSEARSRGSFFFEGDAIISHQYALKVTKHSKVDVSIQPLVQPYGASTEAPDCQLFIFRQNEPEEKKNQKNKSTQEHQYQFVGRTPTVMGICEDREDLPTYQGQIEAGSYILVPATSGCRLTKRKKQPETDHIQLVEVKTCGAEVKTTDGEIKIADGESPVPVGSDGIGVDVSEVAIARHDMSSSGETKVELRQEFTALLKDIFEQVDLDENGALTRQEFNLFNWRTSGEEVQDDEWKVLVENFCLQDGELALNGFLQLHQMEAEDNGGDCAELWVTLNAMGYNHGLKQDESAPFAISVRCENEETAFLSVCGLKSGGPLLDKALIRSIVDGCSESRALDAHGEVTVYREDSGPCASFVVENRSTATATLSLDFSESRNVIINHPHLAFTTTLSARSTLFVAHLLPKNTAKDHLVRFKEGLIRLK